ncbi:hypothetical protein EC511_03820 [Helicobacter pylori]|nr:hypothetical protein EC511_03820 [Helicobacter pylori]
MKNTSYPKIVFRNLSNIFVTIYTVKLFFKKVKLVNYWTKLSIEYANQRSYLDDLFQVYPTIPEGLREIDSKIWSNIEYHFKQKDNLALIAELLNLDLFPN